MDARVASPLRPGLSEDQFKDIVIDYAILRGWLVHHSRPAIARSGRWLTPLQGHKGLPDLVLARGGQVILAELKSDKGRASVEQRAWLGALGTYGRLWRPADWPVIHAELW